MEVRDLTISFLFDAIRWDDERSLVKLGAFNVLCMVLKLICNNKIVDMSAVYLELKEEQMAYIDKFVSNQIGVISYNSFEDSNGSFSMDLSRMFNTLSFESQ